MNINIRVGLLLSSLLLLLLILLLYLLLLLHLVEPLLLIIKLVILDVIVGGRSKVSRRITCFLVLSPLNQLVLLLMRHVLLLLMMLNMLKWMLSVSNMHVVLICLMLIRLKLNYSLLELLIEGYRANCWLMLNHLAMLLLREVLLRSTMEFLLRLGTLRDKRLEPKGRILKSNSIMWGYPIVTNIGNVIIHRM